MRNLIPALFFSVLCATACNKASDSTDIDKVPVGTDVQVTRQDGGLVEGKLAARDEAAVRVEKGATTRSVPRKDIADVRVSPPPVAAPAPAPAASEEAPAARVARPEPPPRATFREVTIPASTKLSIRLQSDVSSERSKVEDVVRAELSEPVVIDGDTVLPAGTALKGVVTEAVPSGRVKGRASLGLHFTTITVDGADYPINARFARTAESTTRSDAEKIGIPAVGGAVVGAIIGGKKGAAIGAAAGGGAGAAVVLTTPGEPIALGDGTLLSLTIGEPVDVRVKLR
jgi:hypothetical protein